MLMNCREKGSNGARSSRLEPTPRSAGGSYEIVVAVPWLALGNHLPDGPWAAVVG